MATTGHVASKADTDIKLKMDLEREGPTKSQRKITKGLFHPGSKNIVRLEVQNIVCKKSVRSLTQNKFFKDVKQLNAKKFECNLAIEAGNAAGLVRAKSNRRIPLFSRKSQGSPFS